MSIINLAYSSLCLKNLFHLLNRIFWSYGALWLVDYKINYDFFRIFLELNFLEGQRSFPYSWNRKWISGLLCNFKEVFKKNLIDWQYIRYPKSVLFLGLSDYYFASQEPYNSSSPMPILAFVDTSSNIKAYDYNIPGNEKSFTALFFYYKIMLRYTIRLYYSEKFLFFSKITKKN